MDTNATWWCKACFATHVLKRQPEATRPHSSTVKAARDAGAGPRHAASGPDQLAIDPLSLASPPPTGKTRAPCPMCGARMEIGVPACAVCAYDPRSVPLEPGKAEAVLGDFDPDATPTHERKKRIRKPPLKAAAPVPHLCKECKYDLTGVPAEKSGGLKCPECATLNRFMTRRAVDEETSREINRWTYLKPALMGAGGLAAYSVLLLAQGWLQGGFRGALSGWVKAPGQSGWGVAFTHLGVGMALYVWMVIVGSMVTLLASFLWIGLSNTLRATVLNVSGLMAVALALELFFFTLPIPIPWWAVSTLCGIIYAYYLTDMQDWYFQEGAIVTGATWVVMWVSVIVIGVL